MILFGGFKFLVFDGVYQEMLLFLKLGNGSVWRMMLLNVGIFGFLMVTVGIW